MSLTAWEFQHSINCDAPRPFVWTFWTDVSNWQKLEGEAVEWCRLDGPFAECLAAGGRSDPQLDLFPSAS